MKKKYRYIFFFVYLPVAGRNEKKINKENGFQIFYSVKLKKKEKKINFYKFILMYWRIMKKKTWICFWVFPIAGKKKY